MMPLRLTCLCGCCQSPGVRRDWTGVNHSGHIPEDWLCTAQLAALSSSPLSLGRHHHQLSLCRLSPDSASHTYCSGSSSSSSSSSSSRGKAGGCRLCDQSLSLPLSLSVSLSLSLSLSLLRALCLSSSLATGDRSWGDEQKKKKHSGKVFID